MFDTISKFNHNSFSKVNHIVESEMMSMNLLYFVMLKSIGLSCTLSRSFNYGFFFTRLHIGKYILTILYRSFKCWYQLDGEGQGSLVYCSPWGHRVRHDWATEQQHLPRVLKYSQMIWFLLTALVNFSSLHIQHRSLSLHCLNAGENFCPPSMILNICCCNGETTK